jgi:MFS superfamily sulfate permease-like transporter
LDQPGKRFITDVLGVLVLLLVSIFAYWVYSVPAILLAGGLALTVWVAADIVLFRKG